VKLLSTGLAARELGVHPNTLRGWVDRGLVPAVRLPSGYRRFLPEQVEQIKQDMLRGKAVAKTSLEADYATAI
jgi:DNA-binding transcriptional MerR regulator